MREKRNPDRISQVYRRAFAGFFILMAVCSVISRIYDSAAVPKVETAWMKEKAVETTVTGSGTVKAREVFFCKVYPGLYVGSVAAVLGKQVEEGEELFSYDADAMARQREKLEGELQKLLLEREKNQVTLRGVAQIKEQELAAWELQLAEQELAKGQQEHEEKKREHEEELERLQQEYERKRSMAEEELWEQQEQQEEAARQELHLAKNSRESSLRAARRKVEDLEEELEEWKEGDAQAGEIARKERELARAREDLEDLEEEWEDRIGDMEAQIDLIDDRNDRIRTGNISSLTALSEAYEETLRQKNAAAREEEKVLDTYRKNVERARFNLQAAIKRDEQASFLLEQEKQLSRLVGQGIEMDIRAKEEEAERLDLLIGGQGKVCAEKKGTIVEAELLAGKTSTGEERVAIASGDFWFEGGFEKEGQKLEKGDWIQITIPGKNKKTEARIEEMNLLGEEGIFRAQLPGGEIPLGSIAAYECSKQSGIYPQVIPLQGLRKDMKGYYCLVARPRKSILGQEFVAERVDVEVLCLGSTEAAVEGALLHSDEIIVRGSQVIGEGDRVRPVEEF